MDVNKRKAESIDLYVGERINQRRRSLGMTQKDMAERLNVSYQQFQKYEKGQNRLSAGKIYRIAGLLDVSISWFFDGLPTPGDTMSEERKTIENRFPRLNDINNSSVEASLRDLIDAIANKDPKK